MSTAPNLDAIPTDMKTARVARAQALTDPTEATEVANAAQAIADREAAAATRAR